MHGSGVATFLQGVVRTAGDWRHTRAPPPHSLSGQCGSRAASRPLNRILEIRVFEFAGQRGISSFADNHVPIIR